MPKQELLDLKTDIEETQQNDYENNLGSLPPGWQWVKLGDVCNPSKLKSNPLNSEVQRYIGLEHIEKDSMRLLGHGYSNEVRSTKNVFKLGQVLYGKLRPYLNKVVLAPFDGVCSTDIIVLELASDIEGKYLAFYINKPEFVRYAQNSVSGVQHPRTDWNKVKSFAIPLPPTLDEQKRIVDKIEELFSDLDKGIEALKKAKAQIKTYKQSVLKWAFEGRFTNKSVVDGELPEGWQWVKLGDITTILGDGLHGTPIYSDNGDFYFINGNNLNNGKINIKENTKKVSFEEYKKYKKDLSERTVFVSINGTLGNVAFYNNEKVILGKSACYFNLKEDINKSFIKLLIQSQYFINYANQSATGSTIKNVSLKSMRDFLIPLPPTLDEQKQIVEEIENRFTITDKVEEAIEGNLKRADMLRQSILKQAFEGKLV